MARPIVSLLTDFGLRDPSAAICRGVIARICPDAEVVDITHEVRKFAIRDGALMLWCALPYLPVGVHVAVVYPGVGTARRPIAVRVARGDVLVGPDNGLLLGPVERLGGIVAARELANPDYRLEVVTASFHGRDIFAPAGAHLARGVALEALGPAVDPASLIPSPLPEAKLLDDGRLSSEIVYLDTFGNAKLSALATDLTPILDAQGSRDAPTIEARLGDGRRLRLPWARTFGEVAPGDPLLYEDSYGRLCIAINQGNAADGLALVDGMTIELGAPVPSGG